MYPPLDAAALGSVGAGLVAATRVPRFRRRRRLLACGASESGALALALAAAGGLRVPEQRLFAPPARVLRPEPAPVPQQQASPRCRAGRHARPRF